MRRFYFILSLVFFSIPVFSQYLSLLQNEKVNSDIRILESWIRAQMDYKNIPGITVGIIYDQELIWAKGFGYSNLENMIPATSQTLYRIASISKTVIIWGADMLTLPGMVRRHGTLTGQGQAVF
jgi:CubicO group peptidase (beta-lactamase class C family)